MMMMGLADVSQQRENLRIVDVEVDAGGTAEGLQEEDGPAEAPIVTRPRAGHLESMTQSLLSDLAGQNRQIQDLTAEVHALKTRQTTGQVGCLLSTFHALICVHVTDAHDFKRLSM